MTPGGPPPAQGDHLARQAAAAAARDGRARAAALRARAETRLASLASPPGRDPALLAVHDDAWRFYRARLPRSWVPGYLDGRKITAALRQQWGIGYAPPGWTDLISHLRGAGHPDAVIEAAGLARRSSRGTLIDTFRDRAMLPVRDEDGYLVAFIGRAPPAARDADAPRYLNSPQTALYHKGAVLYGLHEARDRLAAGARPVITEGVFDAIAVTASSSRLAGLAASGTALTPQQAAALGRVTGPGGADVLVALDGDPAGRRAAIAAYWILTAVTTRVDAAVLPSGQDPARLLETAGPRALAGALTAGARPLADLVADDRVAQMATSHDGYDRLATATGTYLALRETSRLIATMPPAHIARQAARLAQRLGVSYPDVTTAIADAITSDSQAPKRLARRAGDRRASGQAPAAGTAARGFPRSPAQRAAAQQRPFPRGGPDRSPGSAVRRAHPAGPAGPDAAERG
jgi:DNA primase